jgi:quercetin dioxygenase-like cupin family protein
LPAFVHSFSGDRIMSQYFPTAAELGRHTIFPGVQARTCAADCMLMALVDLQPHAVVEEHSHPHEQVGLWLQGKAVFTIGGEQKTVQAGDMYRIPGHVRHKVVVLEEPARALDIFHPVREEYR